MIRRPPRSLLIRLSPIALPRLVLSVLPKRPDRKPLLLPLLKKPPRTLLVSSTISTTLLRQRELKLESGSPLSISMKKV